jgi:hypothetical protein
VLSGETTTNTKTTELKSLQAGIANELEMRQDELDLLLAEAKTLNDQMQSLASPFTTRLFCVGFAFPPNFTLSNSAPSSEGTIRRDQGSK